MVQRKALIWGAKFHQLLGDVTKAAAYNATAKQIEPALEAHWTDNSTYGPIYQELMGQRPLDSAIHLAINYGNTGDGFIGPSTEKAQASVASYMKAMGGSYFQVNVADDKAGIPGLLTGRYPNDHYQGSNPWILCTQAVGRFYYESATELITAGTVQVTPRNELFFTQILDHARKFPKHQLESTDVVAKLSTILKAGTTLRYSEHSSLFKSLMNLMVGRGDGQLLRVKHHIKSNQLHMPEQLSGTDGSSVSAVDLTWSYGTAIAAMASRSGATQALERL